MLGTARGTTYGCWMLGTARGTTYGSSPSRGNAKATSAKTEVHSTTAVMPQKRIGRRVRRHDRCSAGKPQ